MTEDLFGPKIIRSINYSQDDIINDILALYSKDGGIDLDPTYSIGGFYDGLVKEPRIKMDANPQAPGVMRGDFTALPFKDEVFNTILFDPPFLVHPSLMPTGKMLKRYGYFPTIKKMNATYSQAIKELARGLKKRGVLIFKVQDFIYGRRCYFPHLWICEYARDARIPLRDIFILLSKNRMIPSNYRKQNHARKHHCYFLVFKKARRGRK